MSVGEEQESDGVKRKVMKLEGIGKYPHITVKLCSGTKATSTQTKNRETVVSETVGVSTVTTDFSMHEETDFGRAGECRLGNETVVDFGAVAVGSLVKKKIEITNVSPVSA